MIETSVRRPLPSSFRDPSGHLFLMNGTLYRQLNLRCKEAYVHLMGSGLYQRLVNEGLLIPHREIPLAEPAESGSYKILQPEPIPFVSYPYEWCFSQLKEAALLTLRAQQRALEFNMSLKDASAYNVQFLNGKPILIDTLSFDLHPQGRPWEAYRQFCQHFLAPLALMSCRDVRLGQLLRIYIDGIPLDLAQSLLPRRTLLRPSLLLHLHLHAKAQRRFADRQVPRSGRGMGRWAMLELIDQLKAAVASLTYHPLGNGWANYYVEMKSYSESLESKKRLVSQFLEEIHPEPKIAWDLGSNVGLFSRLISSRGIRTVSFDGDPDCVERNYLECILGNQTHLLPLCMDFTNPSPALGWAHRERLSWFERGPADLALALALVHHLALSNNVPFPRLAEWFAGLCRWLLIEFIPKTDPQVQRLLTNRGDSFDQYHPNAFEETFGRYFSIQRKAPVEGSDRVLYLMENLSSERR